MQSSKLSEKIGRHNKHNHLTTGTREERHIGFNNCIFVSISHSKLT